MNARSYIHTHCYCHMNTLALYIFELQIMDTLIIGDSIVKYNVYLHTSPEM